MFLQIIKSVAVVLLLLCLLPMPYIYYTIVRIFIFVSMIIFTYNDNPKKKFWKYCIYVFFATLFNPLVRIELPRIIWNVIDVLLAAIIFVNLIYEYNKAQKEG